MRSDPTLNCPGVAANRRCDVVPRARWRLVDLMTTDDPRTRHPVRPPVVRGRRVASDTLFGFWKRELGS
eukprot:1705094-Prymnesium_polylepis.1